MFKNSVTTDILMQCMQLSLVALEKRLQQLVTYLYNEPFTLLPLLITFPERHFVCE